MRRKIWSVVWLSLLLGMVLAFFSSPFIHSKGAFAEFAQARALSALILGIVGTIILMIWGGILLRERKKRQEVREKS